eukprot:m.211944 g.211944  ORF g.211944 m.211944 type:complete len:642 (-) comp26150_c1_seq3:61-1986(-)
MIKQRRAEKEAKAAKVKEDEALKREQAATQRKQLMEERREKRASNDESLRQQLREKLQTRLQENEKRKDTVLEQIKETAAASSRHTSLDDAVAVKPFRQPKFCCFCSTSLSSEVMVQAHVHSKSHIQLIRRNTHATTEPDTDKETFTSCIVDTLSEDAVDIGELKGVRKREKRIRKRIAAAAASVDSSSESNALVSTSFSSRINKAVLQTLRAAKNLLDNPPASCLPPYEKALAQVVRLVSSEDSKLFARSKQLTDVAVTAIEHVSRLQNSPDLPPKTLQTRFRAILDSAVALLRVVLCGCACSSLSLGPILLSLIDALKVQMQQDTGRCLGSTGNIAGLLVELLPVALLASGRKAPELQLAEDLTSCFVASGVLYHCKDLFCHVTAVNNNPQVPIIQNLLSLIFVFSKQISYSVKADNAHLLVVFEKTEAFGMVSLMYALTHSWKPGTQQLLPDSSVNIIFKCVQSLNNFAELHLSAVQLVLSMTGPSAEMGHVFLRMLSYCSKQSKNTELLHELVLLLGYFTINQPENQNFLHTGASTAVLPMLCALPFPYFTDSKLTKILFPTLIASCVGNDRNTTVLQQDMSTSLLEDYLTNLIANGVQEKDCQDRLAPHKRLPEAQWKPALQYFTTFTAPLTPTAS